MYDLGVDGVLERLNQLDGILLVSNPCLELWFLLHHHDHRANISTANCLQALTRICPDYSKGKLSDILKTTLSDNISDAMERANGLTNFSNPSTTVVNFIVELSKAQKEKNKN